MKEKRILVIDEHGFSRVCSAILEIEGYKSEIITNAGNLASRLNNGEFTLAITSYPYGAFILKELMYRDIPIIILSDHINKDLIGILEGCEKSCCMIKPLDYQKFKSVVRQAMNGGLSVQGGYRIV